MHKFVILFFMLFVVGGVHAQGRAPEVTTFTSEFTVIGREELRQSNFQMFVNWSVVNRPLYSTLVFEQVLPAGRIINIELPRPFAWVNSTGSGIVALTYPGDDQDRVVLRVRVVNIFSQQTLASKELIISILDSEAEMFFFWADELTPVLRSEVRNGTARILVGWDVLERTSLINIAFEQVLPDGRVVNVELPRPNIWVNSSDNGVVVPVYPGDAVSHIQLQMRVYHLTTGETIAVKSVQVPLLDRIVTPTPTPIISAPSPTALAPIVSHFSVTPTTAIGGDLLTVRWDVSGVQSVQIFLEYAGYLMIDIPPAYGDIGSITFTAPETVQKLDVRLMAVGETATEIGRITVPLTCRVAWFSPNSDYCPEIAPQTAQATYQPFEGGYMIRNFLDGVVVVYYATTNSFSAIAIGDSTIPTSTADTTTYTITHQRTQRSFFVTRGGRMMTNRATFLMFTLPDGSVATWLG